MGTGDLALRFRRARLLLRAGDVGARGALLLLAQDLLWMARGASGRRREVLAGRGRELLELARRVREEAPPPAVPAPPRLSVPPLEPKPDPDPAPSPAPAPPPRVIDGRPVTAFDALIQDLDGNSEDVP